MIEIRTYAACALAVLARASLMGSIVGFGIVSPATAVEVRTKTARNQWPQWRGPLRDGVSSETGLSHDWTRKQPPLLWKTAGMGEGYSSVSIAGGRIFTMGDRGPDQVVIALAETDGRELWAHAYRQRRGKEGVIPVLAAHPRSMES